MSIFPVMNYTLLLLIAAVLIIKMFIINRSVAIHYIVTQMTYSCRLFFLSWSIPIC